MAKLNNSEVAIVMVPLPAQGHLNQLLHLSRLISAYHLPIHFAGNTVHLRQAKTRVHGWDPLSISNIKFHEYQIPNYQTPPPNPNSITKFPSHLMPSFHATCHLLNYQEITKELLLFMILLLHGFFKMPLLYQMLSVTVFVAFQILPADAEDEFLEKISSMESCFTQEFLEFNIVQTKYREMINSGDLYNSCYEIEGLYLDLLAKEKSAGNKQWAIGPLNPVKLFDRRDQIKPHECIEWLDDQEPNSVIFVSFGTTTSLSDEEIQELAMGLERSEQKFIWVLREADKGDIFTGESRKVELPDGYEERVGERGLIVRDWAPQLEILGHVSTGGFMSHCRWNSCMESISMGVPIAAWPMHSDQPRNAFLITEVLKIGLVLKDWEKRDELVSSVAVAECVKRLMDSDEVRQRAMELSKAIVDAGGNGKEMDSFIAHITR
ncbi:hypothetical protein P3S68_029478 [Capsicum galapagoense]